jgi:hypothetical protein
MQLLTACTVSAFRGLCSYKNSLPEVIRQHPANFSQQRDVVRHGHVMKNTSGESHINGTEF